MKVLWVGDAIVNSGFSIVTHNICNELYTKCELIVYGIRYDGRKRHPYPYYIYPAQTALGDMYSFDYLSTVIKEETPDVVVLFNDDHIIEKYLGTLLNDLASPPRIVPLFPVNLLPIDAGRMLEFSRYGIESVMTYTDYSKKKVEEINPNLDVTAIYHGVAPSVFFKIPDAKASLGVEGLFVVGNNNTNTYRKRLDLFLSGFAKFAKGKNDVKCLIHATNKDIAYDLPTLVKDFNISDKTILSGSPLDFEKINMLYNIMDVNVNTSLGEGFGLSLIEGAACAVPVLCPPHGNLKDIWTQGAEFIDIAREEYLAGTSFIGGVISEDSLADKLELLYKDREFLALRGNEALEQSMRDKFSWKVVANKVYKTLVRANSGRLSFIS